MEQKRHRPERPIPPIRKKRPGINLPPVLLFLLKGYLVIAFIFLAVEYGILGNIGLGMLLITVTAFSMLFGIGYFLLVDASPKVDQRKFEIPLVILIFVKTCLVIYFVGLAVAFGVISEWLGSFLMSGIAAAVTVFGALNYVFDVFKWTTVEYRKRRASGM